MHWASEDQCWDHLLHFQAAFSEVAVAIPFSICREHLVQGRADSIYNVFKTTALLQCAALKIFEALREHHCWRCCSNPLQQDRAACGYSCVAPGLGERSSGADNYFQHYSWCGWFMVGWNQQHEMRVVTELFFMIRWWHVSFCWLMTFTGLGHLRNRKPCFQPPVKQFLWGDLKTCNLCLPGSSCALRKLQLVFVA